MERTIKSDMGEPDISNDIRFHSALETEEAAGYEGLSQISDDGFYELSVLVGGVHCAGCIQKIESLFAHQKNVKNARLNFSTRRLSLVWDGDVACSNDFVKSVEGLGYSVQPYDAQVAKNETQAQEKFLLLCLGVAGFAMGNVMLLSVGLWSSSADVMGLATRDFMHWISALIALPTILFSGRPFFRSALGALTKGHANMDVPVSLALLLAGGMSLFETINHGEHVYFDSAVMLMFFLLIGRYLDFRARKNARSSATDLLSTLSGFANVVVDGSMRRVLIRDLKEGMSVRVVAGEKFPVDGFIIDGQSSVDTSLVTGETMPREVSVNCEVYAGTLNISAPVMIEVAKAADNSLLADIVRLMEKAGQGQARYVRLADRAARLYTPVVHSFAAMAFLGWWLLGGLAWQPSLMIAVTVLIITCPCALGLAVPVVQVLASGRLVKNGVLVKSGDALERLAAIDTVMLDKTGTLTRGDLGLVGSYNDDVLRMAASLGGYSAHPLSRAIHAAYKGDLLSVSDVEELSGLGLQGQSNGEAVRLGSRDWCGDPNTEASTDIELWLDAGGKKTRFVFQDSLRADAANTVLKLKNENLDILLVSGDRQDVVDKVAQQVGIDVRYAGQTPVQKFEIMEALQNDHHKVLMVGDGLNDAPVLSGANVSMAPGTAIDMAQNAADIVFMGDGFSPVCETYKIARLTQRLVKQNFVLAIVYNMVAVPLALGGFVTPLIAALCMSGSSLVVIANSFRLKWMSL